LFVVGEEKGGEGMLYFSAHASTNYSAVIFGEPTEGKLASGHKGMLSFVLTITGKAAHSGYPWLGLNANVLMIEALQTLLKLEKDLPSSKLLGPSTLNIGQMQGGVASNVAERATAEVAIRVAAGTPDEIKGMIASALKHIEDKTVAEGGSFELTYSHRAYGPVDIDTDIPGFENMGVNYGTDIPNFKGNHKRYLYGPGSILVAHGPNEHLSVNELEDAVQAYGRMIKYLLGT
jgi:acetylornithine deacetylase